MRVLTNSAGIHPGLASEKAEGQKIWGYQSSNNRMSILSKKCLLQKIEGAPRGPWPTRVPSALGLAPRAVQPALARMNTVSDE